MTEEEAPIASFQTLDEKKVNYQLITTAEERKSLVDKLLRQESVCFDTETTGLNPLTADLIGLAFVMKKIRLFTFILMKEKSKKL